ncbi:hypothetical protein CDD81_2690 [Ophiocordyceps australis]|uniref:Rad51-like C-terminal domain-containing protein n=1 Tax=Ophiocordyceps australis TaxID=1399860 RepID=A0A2C5XJY4_9HYPO|nr:hypothetical protein CDD81_2690 [Ophiocordyceps australis]
MDRYHSVHGHDRASFDTSHIHRLPTVAASQALKEVQNDSTLPISTGLQHLDFLLLSPVSDESTVLRRHGGMKRGQVAEIWGPPGTGKTALAIQMAAHAMCNNDQVVWIDCFNTVDKQRIMRVIDGTKASKRLAIKLDKFIHYSCLTLPHLMALMSRPPTMSVCAGAALVVISGLSALVNSTLPKPQGGQGAPKPGPGLHGSSKRLQGLQFLMNGLQKVAATTNSAVVVLSQCATRMQSYQGATLVAAVNGTVWEQAVSTRLVVFRDWAWRGKGVFVAAVQKVDGKANATDQAVCTFGVQASGTINIECDATTTHPTGPADLVRPKRKLGQTELEVPDSDDEDYGWADEDEEALPPPPPQWQGSEDILLGHGSDASDEGDGEDTDSQGSGNAVKADDQGMSRDGSAASSEAGDTG